MTFLHCLWLAMSLTSFDCRDPVGDAWVVTKNGIHVSNYYDYELRMPPCNSFDDPAIVISYLLNKASELHETMSPLTDAAAWSTEGARVAVIMPPGICEIKSSIILLSGNAIFDGGGHSIIDGKHLPEDAAAISVGIKH